jgi:DNA-binding transcriptional LysR family regulator
MTDHWVGLEFRHLTALRAISDEGSFKGAARLLGYTPSAISQQIASLERIVGVQLIAREHGRTALGPTEAGQILLRHMTTIEAGLSAAKADIDAFARGVVGPLRVGAFESVATRVLPAIIGQFAEVLPAVRVAVDDAVLDLELIRSLERGALDVVFANLPVPPGPFETAIVLNDPWVLVVQDGSEDAAGSVPLTLGDIAELPLVSFRSPRAIDPAVSRFRSFGVELNFVLQSDYNEVVQGFAAAGLGVALMPLLAVNPKDERTAIISLGTLIPPRQVALVWHRDRAANEALDAFVAIAAEIGARVDESNVVPGRAGSPFDASESLPPAQSLPGLGFLRRP